MYIQSKRLKQYALDAGFNPRNIRIRHDRKYVGRTPDGKKFYEVHATYAHYHGLWLKTLPREEAVRMMGHIARRGCEVCYFDSSSDPSKVSSFFYSEIGGEGRLRDISEEARVLARLLFKRGEV